ncbi:MFS transporter [Opitutus terrae]|uniref:Na+/melibiose symporter and related transporters-like protein n=1 Tax=Opitutus terrae (strain DSM 11246 / JCM 15787 / PB90-1) TaxID=452637 RepID=B1ZMQ4_OPITP|nr:MFS transporter [Opitutus terrae]ACB75332.1 Na+/melibiose symporter and related transporters-like protein [Opitutus terrae PB90-1]
MSTETRRETRKEDRVGFWEKTSLGAGYLALFYGNAGVKSLAIPVYQMVLGVNPALLGLVLAIPRFWDALTDPIVGFISDNTHSRFGRRKPIIVIGAIVQALAFGAIWMVPAGMSQTATIAYLIGALLLFYTCFSVFSVPLMSLTYEMTPDYQERTRVAAFGGFFGKIGELTYSWVFWVANLAFFGSVMFGVRTVGWIIAIVVMGLVGMIPGLFVRERYFKKAVKQERVRLGPAFRAAFSNRAFTVLIGLTVCQVLAGMLASNIDYYLLVYYMCDGDIVEGSKWKGVLSTGYAVLGIGMIYPVNWLANRYGKRTTLSLIFGLVLLGGVGKWFIYTPGHLWKILLDPLLCGPVWTALNVLTPSMLADVCDDDELRHGLRREGMLGALFSWIQKTGYALAFFGAGVALNLTGFDATLGGAQAGGTILGMRLTLALSTVLWAAIAIALLCFYPLSRQRAYEIRDQLEARRGTV